MLSTAASNALLKTIEEPPSKVVFILATTNPERVLTTIQSRCQKFDFKRISSNDIYKHLSLIANKESIQFQEQALKLIAKRSNGGMRDAQSLLDQLSLIPEGITTRNVQNLLGEVSEIDLINLINSLIDNKPESLLISCNKLYDEGNEPNQIIVGLLNITRDLLLTSVNNNHAELYYTSLEFQSELNKFTNKLTKSKIIEWHNKLKNVEYQIKSSDNPRLWLEIHLTSLLDKEEIQSITNNQINIKKENLNRSTANQISSDDTNNKKLIHEAKMSNNIEVTKGSKELDDIKTVDEISNLSHFQNNNTDELKDKWELILSKLELPSTRMLLSQQAELVGITSGEVEIAVSQSWENMIKSRKVIIESTVKKIFGEHIKLKFSSKELNKNNAIKSKEKGPEQINDSFPKKELETKKSKLPEEYTQKESYDDSSKNLANFFNGEIIDLDE